MLQLGALTAEDADAPLLAPRKPAEEANFDITAMIDLVFMMNIFFLVTSLTTAMAEVDLPAARHAIPSDPETAVVFSIVAIDEGKSALVYVGSPGKPEDALTPQNEQEAIRAAVEAAVTEGKDTVLIKAERSVAHREVARVAAAAMVVEGMRLNLAVMEAD